MLRSIDKTTFPNGPTYLDEILALPAGYKGPFTTPNIDASSAVQTPDDLTIVFKLNKPFGQFDQFAQLPMTSPVPKAKDTGAKYQEAIVSTGPYKFEYLHERQVVRPRTERELGPGDRSEPQGAS